MQLPEHCTLAPAALRGPTRGGLHRLLRRGDTLLAARAALHHWGALPERDPQRRDRQRHGIFTGCTLQCCYCQNYKISQQALASR